jgi:hypothetical protein
MMMVLLAQEASEHSVTAEMNRLASEKCRILMAPHDEGEGARPSTINVRGASERAENNNRGQSVSGPGNPLE